MSAIQLAGLVAAALAASVALSGLLFWRYGRGEEERFSGAVVFLWWVPAISASAGLAMGDEVSAVTGTALWAGGAVCVLGGRALQGARGREGPADERGR